MVYISTRKHPYRDENVSLKPPIVFNERQGNPHNRGQAAGDPKTSSYTDTAKRLHK